MPYKKNIFIFLKNTSIFLALCFSYVFIGIKFNQFQIASNENYNWFLTIFSVLPVIYLFFLLFLVYDVISSFIISIAFTLIFSIINNQKILHTDKSLTWSDLNFNNINVIINYIEYKDYFIILVFIFFIFISLLLNIKKNNISGITLSKKIILILILTPFIFYQYIGNVNNNLGRAFYTELAKNGFVYNSWRWNENIKSNGIFWHLIQTSRRSIPPKASEHERLSYEKYSQSSAAITTPKKIIYVLCEACWGDKDNFSNIFRPLDDLGFERVEAVSPVFGGGTPNATFEILFGLPSANNVLTGMIFQEYAELMSSMADTLPQKLKKKDYATIAMHNFYRENWKRDIVFPKIGFNQFISIEDMGWDGRDQYPRDKLMYDRAVYELIARKSQNIFMYLITMRTHGPYVVINGDGGEKQYSIALKESIIDFANFSKNIISEDPNVLILLLGDHKPHLPKFFYDKGILSQSHWEHIGKRNEDFLFATTSDPKERGLVPAYIYSNDRVRLNLLREKVNGLPFNCLSAAVDYYFINSGLSSFGFGKDICDARRLNSYKEIQSLYPSWLYSISIFGK